MKMCVCVLMCVRYDGVCVSEDCICVHVIMEVCVEGENISTACYLTGL